MYRRAYRTGDKVNCVAFANQDNNAAHCIGNTINLSEQCDSSPKNIETKCNYYPWDQYRNGFNNQNGYNNQIIRSFFDICDDNRYVKLDLFTLDTGQYF